jgi:type I restriction enzyme R subunit
VELKPERQAGELVAAIEPVRDRLMKRYKAAQEALEAAKAKADDKAPRPPRTR